MDRARVLDADDRTHKAFHHAIDVLTFGELNFLRFRQLLLLVSISVVSVMLLVVSSCYLHHHYYSSGHLLLFSRNNFFYLSTFVFSFFTRTLERKYMFLLCNGILAFLVKSLCFDTDPNLVADDPDPVVVVEMKALAASDGIELSEAVEAVPVEKDGENAAAVPDQEEEEAGGRGEGEAEDQEMGSSPFMEEADGGGRESETLVMEINDDEEDRVEEEAATEAPIMAASSINGGEVDISTEELNRKIEEFIRKMKEEIRIEAQSQLIAV